MKVSSKNFFITIEGIEGVGKSTLVAFLQNWFQQKNISMCMTREPGGTVIAEKIRHLLLDKNTEADEKMAEDTELLLMFAARAQHLACVIKPALAREEWVICDRFTDASYAYQGGGRGIEKEKIALLEKCVQGDLKPDVTFLLDAPANVALARAKNRSHPDRFESEKLAFFERVRAAYLERAKVESQRFKVIDAQKSVEVVKQEVVRVLETLI